MSSTKTTTMTTAPEDAVEHSCHCNKKPQEVDIDDLPDARSRYLDLCNTVDVGRSQAEELLNDLYGLEGGGADERELERTLDTVLSLLQHAQRELIRLEVY